MSKLGNFVKVYDPANPTDWYEVVDQYAREQLILKTEKKYGNALPALPTSKADWDEKKKYLYYYGPLTDQGSTESHYEVWSIFFKLDEQTASAADFTNQANYEWVQLGSTNAELENFSTKGHTHEVVPETSVEDHEYTPQGTVTSTFTGGEATTSTNAHSHTLIPEGSVSSSFSGTPSTTESDTHSHTITPSGTVTSTFSGTQGTTSENTHNHTFTPSGDVSGTFSGEQGTTGNSTTGATITQTKKKLSTKKMSVSPSTSVDFTNSTIAQRATGALEALSTYDASKAVFNGITVDQDGGLSFVVKKMTTDDAVSDLQASIDASKVTYDNSGTASNVDVATGALETDAQAANQVITNAEISDSGHTHTFTPSGAISASFSGTQGTTSDHKHTHTITPEGSVSSSFSGNSGTTSEDTHNHSYTPAGTVTSNFTGSAGTTSEVEHSHTVTPSGEVVSGFRGVRANLKHKVDNKKVRTAPDQEDEGSHAFDWYGIEFDEDLEDPVKTRIGNRDMHRMLPIQTKMRRCLLNDDGTVNYYLDDKDSTKRAGSQEGWVTSEETFMSKVETDEIRDETEEIGVIKGNSGQYNQLANNDASAAVLDSTFNNGIYSCEPQNSQLNVRFDNSAIIGHKYYKSFYVKSDSDSEGRVLFDGGTSWTFEHVPTTWTFYSGISTATNSNSFGLTGYYVSGMSYAPFSAKKIQVIDLTLMGIDNLTTVEQVEAYLAQQYGKRDYYPYNAGTLLSNTMQGIQTVGFNKLDESRIKNGYLVNLNGNETSNQYYKCSDYIPVVPLTTYYLKNVVGADVQYAIIKFDNNKNSLGNAAISGGSITSGTYLIPDGCYYIRVNANINATNICVNISDPAKNGTYEPYNLHSYQRDVTQITGINPNTGVRELVAPNGLQKADMAGTVIDSIYNDVNGNAVCKKMCWDVDFGSLSWLYYAPAGSSYTNGFAANLQVKAKTVQRATAWNIAQINSMGYIAASQCYTAGYMPNKTICTRDGEGLVLQIGDNDISSTDIVSGHIAKLEGEHLIYELETPIIYTDLQWGDGSPVILPIEIEAEKNATIDIIAPTPASGEFELTTCSPTLTMKKYVMQAHANLDGSDGQVMVEIPEHWRKVYKYLNGSTSMLRAMISPYPQDTTGWIHVKKGYVSAYEASIVNSKLCSISDVKNLELSVVDGKVNATCDVSTATGQSDITSQLPTTSVTMDTLRTAARARGESGQYKWNMLVYEQYLALYWLYVIEYANLNSQEAFTTALTSEGFHQGGIGAGVSTLDGSTWNSFNGYRPFVPCGITNCLGNNSGEVLLTLPSGLGGGTVRVNSYRGVEMPFGHIWKFADGIKYLGDGTQQSVLRCDSPVNYSSDSSSTNYTSIGNNVGSNGYKSAILVGDDGDINCAAVEGGSNTYYCDYNYHAHTNGTYCCCILGGAADNGARAGLAYVVSYYGVSYSTSNFDSRLCFFNADI